jgi:FMN hydrolase / 5-amino-6-(5-phospho-D-ribitylamino)uracil phosphatase
MQAAWVNRSDHPWPHEVQAHVTVTNLTELCELFD